MPDNFINLIRNAKNGDDFAISSIKKNIEIIVIHHFMEKNIEIEWIADKNGIVDQNYFYQNLFLEFKTKIDQSIDLFKSFIEYKEFLLKQADAHINDLFSEFYKFLTENNPNVWKVFNKVLKTRVYSWLIKKGISNHDQIETLYQEAQTVFLEKREKNNLNFENSRFLKSYIFKIIHFKILENYNSERKFDKLDNLTEKIDDADIFHQSLSESDKNELNLHLFRDLNELEKTIIIGVYFYDEKLKEIAIKLKISEVNCRVIKHRALIKLEGKVRQLGY